MATEHDRRPGAKAVRPCPVCGKPRSEEHDPFCSRRCADVDLHRWLAGSYAIPAREEDDEDEDGDRDAERGRGRDSDDTAG